VVGCKAKLAYATSLYRSAMTISAEPQVGEETQEDQSRTQEAPKRCPTGMDNSGILARLVLKVHRLEDRVRGARWRGRPPGLARAKNRGNQVDNPLDPIGSGDGGGSGSPYLPAVVPALRIALLGSEAVESIGI